LLLRSLVVGPRWPDVGFTGGPLTHELVIPDGPDGRPGERLMSASRSLYAPRICRDDSREDFRVVLDAHHSTLAAVCLRPSTGPADVEASAGHSLTRHRESGFKGSDEATPERIAGETAHCHSVVLTSGVLTDWKLAHAGWLYVVGVLSKAPPRERETTMRRARAALDTWTWLPDPSRG
jgi:hypothetical protein